MDQSDSLALTFGRVLLALVFIVSAVGKIVGYSETLDYMNRFELPWPALLLVVAIAVELIAGALVFVGWRARGAASLLAAFTLVSALVFHNDWSVAGQFTQFMKHAGLFAGLLMIAGLGAGALSLDNRDVLAESPET